MRPLFSLGTLFALLFMTSAHAAGSEIAFKLHGKPVKAFTVKELIEQAGSELVKVWEPHEKQEVTYRAIPLGKVLQLIYGEEWKKTDELLITCLDGFQPGIAVKTLLSRRGYLAYEREGDPKFTVLKTQEGNVRVELGPLYLVWDNLKDESLREADLLNWPYQVTTFDFLDAAERFPKMAPPKNASAAAKRGFSAFRQHCFACHKVNGEGGDKSIDLVMPVSPAEYWKRPWLVRWILHPQKLRPTTVMPPLPIPGKEGEKVASEIVAYLETMARQRDKANRAN